MRRIAAYVIGRVQGVGFRYFTQDLARQQGVVGWVRNTAEGGVELEAQGPDAAVEALCAGLREGPVLSYVVQVTINNLPLAEGEPGFEIRY